MEPIWVREIEPRLCRVAMKVALRTADAELLALLRECIDIAQDQHDEVWIDPPGVLKPIAESGAAE